MRRGVSLVVLFGMLLMSCSVANTAPPEDLATQPTGASSSASLPPTSTTTTSVGIPGPVGRVGLYDVDPRTLEPVDVSAPITTGDWLSGTSSGNGDWLALTVWIDDEPDTDLIRVVNVADQTVVSEAKVLVPTHPMVADDGTAYWVNGNVAPFLSLYSLQVGAESAELAFNDFPVGFEALTDGTILDTDRIGWLGLFGPQTEEDAPGLVVLDLATSTTTTYLLPEVTVGGGEIDVDETRILEWFQPEATWDAERNLAYVVHADQDAFTVVDLETGETNTHSWGPSTSWFGRLLAFGEGPNPGVEVELEAFGQIFNCPFGDAAAQVAQIGEELARRLAAVSGEVAGQVADPAAHLDPVCPWVETEHSCTPAVGTEDVEQQPDSGGLSGPIRAEKAKYLSRSNLEVESVEGQRVSVTLREPFGDDGINHLIVPFLCS
jgi:hypothetical protein